MRLVCPMQAVLPWRDLWLDVERLFSGGSEDARPGEGFVALRCGHRDVLSDLHPQRWWSGSLVCRSTMLPEKEVQGITDVPVGLDFLPFGDIGVTASATGPLARSQGGVKVYTCRLFRKILYKNYEKLFINNELCRIVLYWSAHHTTSFWSRIAADGWMRRRSGANWDTRSRSPGWVRRP